MANNRPLFITDFSSLDFDCSTGKMRIEFPSDTLVDNLNGTYTHTAVDGTIQVIDTNQTVAILDNTDGTYTITDDAGNVVVIDTNSIASLVTQTVTTGNEIATHSIDGGTTSTPILETITTLVDSGNGVITYTGEDGIAVPLNICTIIESCPVSALSNVATTTDSPVDCALMVWDAATSMWTVTDPTQPLDCALLVA